jgi:serine/threonine protein phosphatase PrpC
MNQCFLLENPEQTPLAGGTRVGALIDDKKKLGDCQFDI